MPYPGYWTAPETLVETPTLRTRTLSIWTRQKGARTMLSLLLTLSLLSLPSCADQPVKPDDEPKPLAPPEQGPPPAANWEQYWEKVASEKLPRLAPEGSLRDLRLALTRQIEACRAYLADQAMPTHPHCRTETVPVRLECDLPALEKLRELTRTSPGWNTFYRKVKLAFDFYQYRHNQGSVLYTGYNSPVYEASLTKGGKYVYPAYGRPEDLVNIHDEKGQSLWRRRLKDGSLERYHTRKEIDVDKVLEGKGLEVAWFEHPADILRLQIEGSGVLEVRGANGAKEIHGINFAGKNGHRYISVFKVLKNKGVARKYLSFPGLRKYFQDFPDQLWPVLTASPSYVFFSVGSEPPCGTARVHVTGGHSLAVDPTHFPLGLVGFVAGERPVEGSDPNQAVAPMKKFTRFAVAQDTGGAIKQAHVDFYWGSTDYAQLASNVMKAHGQLFRVKLKK